MLLGVPLGENHPGRRLVTPAAVLREPEFRTSLRVVGPGPPYRLLCQCTCDMVRHICARESSGIFDAHFGFVCDVLWLRCSCSCLGVSAQFPLVLIPSFSGNNLLPVCMTGMYAGYPCLLSYLVSLAEKTASSPFQNQSEARARERSLR